MVSGDEYPLYLDARFISRASFCILAVLSGLLTFKSV
jgi:hypothetical protein